MKIRIQKHRSSRWRTAALVAVLASPASALNICFPPPTGVPGLWGPPSWAGSAPIRLDLNEPRWAASPLTALASDATFNDGHVRLLTSADGTKLYVSLQTSQEQDVRSSQDKIFFGISKDVAGTNNIAHGVMIRLRTGAPANEFISPNQFVDYSYDVGATPPWSTVSSKPAWVLDPGAWSSQSDASEWGINFVVNLSDPALGISNTDTFKVAVGMIIRNETAISDRTIYTPVAPLPVGTVTVFGPSGNLLATPSGWAQADATSAGCVGGISLNYSQIAVNGGSDIDTANTFVNHFTADPSFGVVPVAANTLSAEFRIANWGSIADPNAGWNPIPSATGLGNAASTGHIEFTCPANTASQTCGMAVPATKHQCVQVRLNHGAGYNHANAPIANGAAYRNMDFVPLSTSERQAEISLKGLAATASGKRDVYLMVSSRNMPAHGAEQRYLKTDAMARTKAEFLAPVKPPGQVVKSPREAEAVLRGLRKEQLAEAARQAKLLAGDEKLRAAQAEAAKTLPTLKTTEDQLREVWPNYEVRPYYDSGSVSVEDQTTYPILVPMAPFLMYFSHEGPLFGFSQELSAVDGAELTTIREATPTTVGVYKLTMAAQGVAHIKTTVTAHEAPPPKASEEVKPQVCQDVKVEHHHGCAAAPNSGPNRLGWAALLALGFAGVGLARRRTSKGRA